MTSDRMVPFSSEDPQMEDAIDHAKFTIKEFLDAFLKPTTQQTSFLLKVVFDEGDQREHIWPTDLEFTGPIPSGVVANEPALPSLSFMQRVEFDPSNISDWMYIDGGPLFWHDG